jgi:hypothetical protein
MSQYNSPLSKLYYDINSNKLDLEYTGNLSEIFKDLTSPKTFKSRFINSSKISPIDINNALHPPRILRKLLDFKINSSSEVKLECLNAGINSVLRMYQIPQITPNLSIHLYNYFKSVLSKSDFTQLIFEEIHQQSDTISFDSSNPKLSFDFVKNLEQRLTCKDILFIPLGYGGIMPGLDVFNKYTNNNPDSKSVFYPVRFSREKLKDKTPQLNLEEIYKLEILAKTKQVVIFDEDCYSGLTLEIAKTFFQNNLKQKDILSYANISRNPIYSLKTLNNS